MVWTRWRQGAAFYNTPVTKSKLQSGYDPACRACPRLAGYLDQVRQKHPDYHARPVAAFGPKHAALLVVGLAPGLHGANRTGRPFTGDHAGVLLYRTLHKFGLASGPVSEAADDELQLLDARITNSVKCLPPANKPLPVEIQTCNQFLRAELAQMPRMRVILALGAVAHAAVLRACGLPASGHRFAHAAEHSLGQDRLLLDSYHCSRYFSFNDTATTAMFEGVIGRARELAHAARQE